MAKEKVKKEKGPHHGWKVFGKVVCIVLAVFLVIYFVLFLLTRPVLDTSEKARPVGGLLKSETIDYYSETAHGVKQNPIVMMMQVVWKGVYGSDMKKHEDQTPPTDLVVDEDIPYIDDGNFYHELNVYYPEGLKKKQKLPVIIDIHGGGWMYADKDLNDYYCRALADRGYVVFSMSYRLVPDVVVGDQIQDVAAALEWIAANMGEYPCNEDQVLLTGDSAGGMLAIYTALIQESSELRAQFNVPKVDMDISCLLLTSPVPNSDQDLMGKFYTKFLWGKDTKETGLNNLMNLEDLYPYVNAEDIPPTYLITSTGDSLAEKQTNQTYDELTALGVKCHIEDYGEVDGEKLVHVFSVLDPFDEAGVTAIDGGLAFFQEVIGEQK